MIHQLNTVTFKNHTKTHIVGENKLVEIFNDDNRLIRQIKYDKFNRDFETKSFDELGNISEFMHKEYFETKNEKGYIETFKNKFQEYIRKSYTKIENGFKHCIDDYTSKSCPQNSYINDFIYDLKGKLIKIESLKKHK